MSLPRDQQAILDQMDQALGAADPQLRSTYAAFARRTARAPFPAAEVIAARPVRFLVLGLIVVLAVGFLALGISRLNNVNNSCPAPAWHGVCARSAVTSGQGTPGQGTPGQGGPGQAG